MKRFAYYREVADGEFSEAGLSQYLVLLSIYLTCQYKEVSSLQFLLSQETDIDAYCASPNHKIALPTVVGAPQLEIAAESPSSVCGPRDRKEDETDLEEDDSPPSNRC
jgi:hypothetical protein